MEETNFKNISDEVADVANEIAVEKSGAGKGLIVGLGIAVAGAVAAGIVFYRKHKKAKEEDAEEIVDVDDLFDDSVVEEVFPSDN